MIFNGYLSRLCRSLQPPERVVKHLKEFKNKVTASPAIGPVSLCQQLWAPHLVYHHKREVIAQEAWQFNQLNQE